MTVRIFFKSDPRFKDYFHVKEILETEERFYLTPFANYGEEYYFTKNDIVGLPQIVESEIN